MLFTYVRGLGWHIATQMAVSTACLIGMGVLFWGLPTVVTTLIGDPPAHLRSVFSYYGWVMLAAYVSVAITFWSSGVLLRKHLASRHEDPRLTASLRRMAARAGLTRVPRLTMLNIGEKMPNAAAAWSPLGGNFVIASGQVHRILTDDAEDAVFAHEIAHIKHGDLLVRALVVTGSSALSLQIALMLLWEVAAMIGIFHAGDRTYLGYVGRAAMATLCIKVVYDLLAAMHSRSREYLADVGAIAIAGGSQSRKDLILGILQVGVAVLHAAPITVFRRASASLFASHPSAEDRARALGVFVVGLDSGDVAIVSSDDIA